MYEIYLVAHGHNVAEVNGKQITLEEGDILVVEPGEVHTFVENSPDYMHFVVQTPLFQTTKLSCDG